MNDLSKLLPARTLAKKLGFPRARIQEWKEAGIISFTTIGKRDKFDLALVRKQITEHFKSERKS